MPTIETQATLPADPGQVFDLIRDVESFPRYTRSVEEVVPLGAERYRWKTRVAGKRYEWDVEVIQSERPSRIAWRSLTGIQNTGRYFLTPVPEGTHLRLVIEFTLKHRLLDATLGKVAGPIVRSISNEVLTALREEFHWKLDQR